MKRSEEDLIKASIVEAIENWWDGGAQALDLHMPYVGGEAFSLMAQAALTVLLALDDAQRQMITDGIVKADDF